jgi:hypothetical protein
MEQRWRERHGHRPWVNRTDVLPRRCYAGPRSLRYLVVTSDCGLRKLRPLETPFHQLIEMGIAEQNL